MSTLQLPDPPQKHHTNHTGKHPRPRRLTSTNKAPSTPSIHQKLEHMENKHPHIHQCIPPPHIDAHWPAVERDVQKQYTPINAEGRLHRPVLSAHQQHTKRTTSGHEHLPAQSTQPSPGNPETPKQSQNIPMIAVPKWSKCKSKLTFTKY